MGRFAGLRSEFIQGSLVSVIQLLNEGQALVKRSVVLHASVPLPGPRLSVDKPLTGMDRD